jgi:type IV pilus assembly protein PilQ
MLRGNLNGAVNLPVIGAGSMTYLLANRALTRVLSIELSALEADGRGKIVSSPRVLAKNGQPAKIEQGTEIPYLEASSSGATKVSFKKAVLSLVVTPTINADGRIGLDLNVNKDSPGQLVPGGIAIDTKQVSTKVVVDNGGTIVIGGIFLETERVDDQKVPVLGDLPYVGWLFKQRQRRSTRSELLVFITPRIVNDQLTLQ